MKKVMDRGKKSKTLSEVNSVQKISNNSTCCKDVYVSSFSLCTARLWNSLPTECFPLTYDP